METWFLEAGQQKADSNQRANRNDKSDGRPRQFCSRERRKGRRCDVCLLHNRGLQYIRMERKLTQGTSNGVRRRRSLPDWLSCGCIEKVTGAQNTPSIMPAPARPVRCTTLSLRCDGGGNCSWGVAWPLGTSTILQRNGAKDPLRTFSPSRDRWCRLAKAHSAKRRARR